LSGINSVYVDNCKYLQNAPVFSADKS